MAFPALRAAACGLLLASAAGCSAVVPPPPAPRSATPGVYQSQSKPGATLDRAAAADMVSALRQANGRGPVTLDPALNRMADEQARAMARADKLSHAVDGSLKERIARAGYSHGGMVENIGAGHDTLADAFTGWRASPPHLRNMLSPKVERIGIAAARAPGSRYEVFWAMVLADPNDPRPTAAEIAARVPDLARSVRPPSSSLMVNGVALPR